MDTFLNLNQFQSIQSIVSKHLDNISKLPRDKRVKYIKQEFEFERCFEANSVQGIAGIINIYLPNEFQENSNEEPKSYSKHKLVFKLSIGINRVIEHEHFILKRLNAIRSYCPNFVGTYGLLPAYVSRSFFDETEHKEDKNVFDVKQNAIQTNYLLLEYVNHITFRNMIKYSDIQTISSCIYSILCSLKMSQLKFNFTHYDLHSANILMREVEKDSYFAYIIENEVYVFPTFGWFPVMIDMGSSYLKGIEERPTRTHIANYQNGLQSTVYDPLGDIHHFVIHTVSKLEKCEKQTDECRTHFRGIATRMMHIFRYNDIWRMKGWKQLPSNLYDLFNQLVKSSETKLCRFYTMNRTNIIEIMTLGVKLPWKQLTNEEIRTLIHIHYPSLKWEQFEHMNILQICVKLALEDICHFLDALSNDPSIVKSKTILYYILRALFEHASLIQLDLNQLENISNKTNKEWICPKHTINEFKQTIHVLYPHLHFKLDLNKSFRGASLLCNILRHIWYIFLQPNIECMNEWYNKTTEGDPLTILRFLQKNTSMRYNFKSTSPIYIWNMDSQTNKRISFNQLNCKKIIRKDCFETTKKSLEEGIKNLFC